MTNLNENESDKFPY